MSLKEQLFLSSLKTEKIYIDKIYYDILYYCIQYTTGGIIKNIQQEMSLVVRRFEATGSHSDRERV